MPRRLARPASYPLAHHCISCARTVSPAAFCRSIPANWTYRGNGLPCFHPSAPSADRSTSRADRDPRRRVGHRGRGMRQSGREKHADYLFGFRRGRRRGERHAGRSDRGHGSVRHPCLRAELRGLLQRTWPRRDDVQPDGGNAGGPERRLCVTETNWRHRAIRWYRVFVVQSRQGGGPGI